MKRLNGKIYHSQEEIYKKLRTIYLDDMIDVATYCEWVVVYEGLAKPVIEGLCRGITNAARAIKNTEESHLSFVQLKNTLRECMHGNFDFDIREFLETCNNSDPDLGWRRFLENEGIAICLTYLRELDNYDNK